MSKDDHKIDADDRTVFEVLNERKYTVDYFQREYSWEQKHIEQLITDLTSTFLDVYKEGDPRTAGEHYNNYYLGPFVVSSRDGMKSIIDGQQRLTSLTLFLIFLNHLQKGLGYNETIAPLIFSDLRGQKSFNIQVEERKACLKNLFEDGEYEIMPDDDESTVNMALRYADIAEAFPEELKGKALPYFLDWLKYNVILVEITAYSDDNAYTIFEAMNDRGLNLTSTEMLKGYVLSRFPDSADRATANNFWRDAIHKLHQHSKDEDQQFFQALLRSQYADTIRQGRAGSSNEDFEKIGTRFHSWFRDNLEKVGLADSAVAFRTFVHRDMDFYVKAYLDIVDARQEERVGSEQLFYTSICGIAPSLAFPLMLAPLKPSDGADEIQKKIKTVASFNETFVIKRSINFRTCSASSLRYTMYTLVKEIRGKGLEELTVILQDRLDKMEETWEGLSDFRMHGMNKWFVHYLLARITGFVEQHAGMKTSFSKYYVRKPGTKPFEVEHIWADKFEEHRDEFDQRNDFDNYRNRIGDLVLLPQGTNQSFGANPFADKVDHYLKENLWAQSLHPKAYENNPNFTGMARTLGLNFKPHTSFTKADIDERQALVRNICEMIWSPLSESKEQ